MAPPPEKKAKTDAETAPVEKEEEYVEVELNATPVKGKTIPGPVLFHTKDTTINAMVSESTGMLRTFSEGGLAHLLAGAKANVGVKSGRCMFEVSVVESISPASESKGEKNVLKVGVSTGASNYFIGDGEESVGFDLNGAFWHKRVKTPACKKMNRKATVLAVLLNLDKKSENGNTISLFADGVRMCKPQPLPAALSGKTLFPTVTYKNVTLHLNFGPEPRAPLPFKCHMIQGSMDATCGEVVAAPAAPKDGKYEVIYPSGLPDEGCYEWLDMFLEKNPQYTELSDRALVAWAEKSGIRAAKASSKDKFDGKFGVSGLDDAGYSAMIRKLAPMQDRHFLVMNLHTILNKESRVKALESFPASKFKRIAQIVVGEPTPDFLKKTQALNLQAKQEQADKEFKTAQMAKKNARLAEKRKKEQEKLQKKKQAEMKKKVAAAKKAAAKKAAEAKGETLPEEEAAEEPEEAEEEEPEEEVVDEMTVPPPKVELTAEEKKVKFFKDKTPDVTSFVMSTTFSNFSIPAKDEGFDDIRYAWTKAGQCETYVKNWVMERKMTTRVEDIKPSAWFTSQASRFNGSVKDWQGSIVKYKAAINKKEADKKAKALKRQAALAKAKAKATQKETLKKKLEAEGKEIPAELLKEDEPMEVEEEEEVEEETPPDFEEIDIFGVEDVCDIGAGMPLCNQFNAEDWALLNLRFELCFLIHAFSKDAGEDSDRPGVYIDHVAFYYQKYFKKDLKPAAYGVADVPAILSLVADTVHVGANKCLETLIPADMEKFSIFLKLAEEERRRRNILMATGEESAKLKLTPEVLKAVGPTNGASGGGGGSWTPGGKGAGGGGGKGAKDAGGKGAWGGKGKW